MGVSSGGESDQGEVPDDSAEEIHHARSVKVVLAQPDEGVGGEEGVRWHAYLLNVLRAAPAV